jgi:hypothetical protein
MLMNCCHSCAKLMNKMINLPIVNSPCTLVITPLLHRYCIGQKTRTNILDYTDFISSITVWCVPATSAAVERCFSAAGYISSARRNRLSDSLLENMLVARCNRDLLQ